jgi:hypothetical protein
LKPLGDNRPSEKPVKIEVHLAVEPSLGVDAPHIETFAWEVNDVPQVKIDSSTSLWRYLTLQKLLSFLHRRALWFSRVDLLGDPFEGSTPPIHVRRRNESKTENPDEIRRAYYTTRRWITVNCWYMGEHESDALWRIYAPNGEGVAIRAKQQNLVATLKSSKCHYYLADAGLTPVRLPYFLLGPVGYMDMNQVELMNSHPFERYFLKRAAFSHEHEYRAVAPLPELLLDECVQEDRKPPSAGVYVEVDISTLIEEVLIAPNSAVWFRDAIHAVCEKFQLSVPIKVSSLDENPLF